MDSRLADLLHDHLASGFADLEGARVSAAVPLTERVINDALTRTLPRHGAVHGLYVRPRDGDRFDVQIKLAKPSFLPPVSLTAAVDRQPEFPASPVLALRITSLPGLVSAAGFGAAIFNVLPPGVSMHGDRVLVDVAALLRQHGAGAVVPFIERVRITSTDARALVELDLRIARK